MTEDAVPMLDILIVDDSPADREMLKRCLENAPLRCGKIARIREAGSGSEALDACQEGQPDCLIIDYRLPDVTGLDFLREMSPYLPNQHPPVIVVTGNGSEAVAADTVRLGATDYLTKDRLTRNSIRRSVDTAVERFRIQRQLRRYHSALERSNADLTNFAARLAHDLRNPINFVKGYSELLKIQPDLPIEKRDEYLTNITDGLDRMDRMLHALYQFSTVKQDKALAGRVPLEGVFFDVRKLMADRIAAEGATLSLPDAAPAVVGDHGLLLLLMQNLISNSLKYRGDASPRIVVTAEERESRIIVSVSDNGRGVPEEHRERIFDMFHRVDPDVGVDGSGIGLATCRRIVERHDGTIWCAPNDGVGTTISFTLSPAKL